MDALWWVWLWLGSGARNSRLGMGPCAPVGAWDQASFACWQGSFSRESSPLSKSPHIHLSICLFGLGPLSLVGSRLG